MTTDREYVATTMRLELELYMWIRDYVYGIKRSQQGRNSLNQTINELLAEAIEARKKQEQNNVI
jgi:hypothetical protein